MLFFPTLADHTKGLGKSSHHSGPQRTHFWIGVVPLALPSLS